MRVEIAYHECLEVSLHAENEAEQIMLGIALSSKNPQGGYDVAFKGEHHTYEHTKSSKVKFIFAKYPTAGRTT